MGFGGLLDCAGNIPVRQQEYFMNDVVSRIKQLKGEMSVPDFARFIGEEKSQRLQDVLAKRQRLPEDMLIRILQATGCDANWLLLGRPRPAGDLPPRQRALLANYEAAPEDGKRVIEGAALLAAKSPAPTKPGKKAA